MIFYDLKNENDDEHEIRKMVIAYMLIPYSNLRFDLT